MLTTCLGGLARPPLPDPLVCKWQSCPLWPLWFNFQSLFPYMLDLLFRLLWGLEVGMWAWVPSEASEILQSLTARLLTPRRHSITEKLSHRLEPGSSWEDGGSSYPNHLIGCARPFQSRQDEKPQLAQSMPKACQVPCGCTQRRLRREPGKAYYIRVGKSTEIDCPGLP